jgi:hypothetical protein
MTDTSHSSPTSGTSRWFGSGAVVALAVLIAGRFAAEGLRGLPHFDERGGMDAYGAVETYCLKKNPNPVEVACFGTSQSVFGISAKEVAEGLGEKTERVRNLGTPGGTPFDMWSMVRRNPECFKDLHLAVVEINPFVLQKGLEGAEPQPEGDPARADDHCQCGDATPAVDGSRTALVFRPAVIAHDVSQCARSVPWQLGVPVP